MLRPKSALLTEFRLRFNFSLKFLSNFSRTLAAVHYFTGVVCLLQMKFQSINYLYFFLKESIMIIFCNVNTPGQRLLHSWLHIGALVIAFALLVTSCDSVLNGNLPRTTELLSQPAQLTSADAVIKNSSGNVKIKSIKASFVATSLPDYDKETDTTKAGIALVSNGQIVSLNGKVIARGVDGKLAPTDQSVAWDCSVEVPTIDYNVGNTVVTTFDSTTGVATSRVIQKESLNATINATALDVSANNQKLLDVYKVAVKSVQLKINDYPNPPFIDRSTSPWTFGQTLSYVFQWDYKGVRIGTSSNPAQASSGGPGWVPDKEKKTITFFYPKVESSRVNGQSVAILIVGQYVISYE